MASKSPNASHNYYRCPICTSTKFIRSDHWKKHAWSAHSSRDLQPIKPPSKYKKPYIPDHIILRKIKKEMLEKPRKGSYKGNRNRKELCPRCNHVFRSDYLKHHLPICEKRTSIKEPNQDIIVQKELEATPFDTPIKDSKPGTIFRKEAEFLNLWNEKTGRIQRFPLFMNWETENTFRAGELAEVVKGNRSPLNHGRDDDRQSEEREIKICQQAREEKLLKDVDEWDEAQRMHPDATPQELCRMLRKASNPKMSTSSGTSTIVSGSMSVPVRLNTIGKL